MVFGYLICSFLRLLFFVFDLFFFVLGQALNSSRLLILPLPPVSNCFMYLLRVSRSSPCYIILYYMLYISLSIYTNTYIYIYIYIHITRVYIYIYIYICIVSNCFMYLLRVSRSSPYYIILHTIIYCHNIL